MVWMPKMMKEEISDKLKAACADMGMPELYDMIATEEQGTTEAEILAFMKEKGHPALEMEVAMG
jgi:acetyl-CoA synthase